MKYTLFIVFLLIGINSFAQDPITAHQAAKMVGKEVTVKAVVASTRLFEKEGKKTFLINLDKRYQLYSIQKRTMI